MRALRIVDAAQFGPWPPAAFSKLCNCLKDAPPSLIDVRLSLRPMRLDTELLVQNPQLRGGGATFSCADIGAEGLGGSLRAAMTHSAAEGGDAAARQIARLWI